MKAGTVFLIDTAPNISIGAQTQSLESIFILALAHKIHMGWMSNEKAIALKGKRSVTAVTQEKNEKNKQVIVAV